MIGVEPAVVEAYLGDTETAARDPLLHMHEGAYLLGCMVTHRGVLRLLGLPAPNVKLEDRLRAHLDRILERNH